VGQLCSREREEHQIKTDPTPKKPIAKTIIEPIGSIRPILTHPFADAKPHRRPEQHRPGKYADKENEEIVVDCAAVTLHRLKVAANVVLEPETTKEVRLCVDSDPYVPGGGGKDKEQQPIDQSAVPEQVEPARPCQEQEDSSRGQHQADW